MREEWTQERPQERAPGRPRGFDLDATLEIIMDLFWARGYEAVSLADITAATGLRKGSLYTAYGDKQSMYLKALARYDAKQVRHAVDTLRGPSAAYERLRAFLTAPIAASGATDERGCFLCNASADRAAQDPEAAAIIRDGFEKIERALTLTVSELAPDLAPEAADRAAAACLAIYAGLRVMARSGVPLSMLKAARDNALAGLPRSG